MDVVFGEVSPVDIVVLAPHPDDAELAMGGTLFKMVAEGIRVGVVDLTNGEPTPMGDPETRREEARKAAEILGIAFRVILGLKNRELMDGVEARYRVAEVLRLARSRYVFVPWIQDAHPDHIQAHFLGVAARFYAKLTKTDMRGEPHYPEKIIFYSPSHLNFLFRPRFIVDVSDTFPRKRALVETYASQFGWGNRAERLWERMTVKARFYGGLIGAQYGEPFFTEEEVGIRNLRSFLF